MDERAERAEINGLIQEAIARNASGLERFVTMALGSGGDATSVVTAVVEDAARLVGQDREAMRPGRLFGAARKRVAQGERARRERTDIESTELETTLRAIRPSEREALLCRYLGGLTWADVAIACATDEATARERASRALHQLVHGASPDADGTADVLAMRRSVERHLASLVDGDAPPEVTAFADDDDVVRDLVHDAERALGDIRAAAATASIDARALEAAALAAFAQSASAPATSGSASSDVVMPAAVPVVPDVAAVAESVPSVPSVPAPHESLPAPSTPVVVPAASPMASAVPASAPTAPVTSPTATTAPAPPSAPYSAPTAPASTASDATTKNVPTAAKGAAVPEPAKTRTLSPRGRVFALVGGVALLIGAVIAIARSGDRGGANDAWSGKVDAVSHTPGGGAGLERCAPDHGSCSALDTGDVVPAGSTLRTDGQTRAVVLLADGTRVVLDRDTELALDGNAARRARLVNGAAIVDVADLGTSRARVDAPLGYAETSAAKLSLSVEPEVFEVEVVRGSVRLNDTLERGVMVRSGETGHLDAGAPPEVFATSVMGGSFQWGERAFAPKESGEEIRGLGELKAQKPGESQERKGAVTLTSHFTKVRIVGNVARTEIEEEFANGTDDVLEGIYRFPLPPDAQIERLALDVDGKLVDGSFLDRERAAAIWRGAIVNAGAKKPVGEEIVWVPGPWRDPALLEWQRGGRFELRIYPIPKRGSRKVVLAYTQLVQPTGNTRRYTYPLPVDPSGGSRVGRFDVDVQVRGNDPKTKIVARGYSLRQEALSDSAQSLTLTAKDFTPSGDLSVEYTLPGQGSELTAWAYQPGPDELPAPPAFQPTAFQDLVSTPRGPSFPDSNAAAYVAIALRPKLPHVEGGPARGFAVIVDSSRSMFGERYRRAADLAARLVAEMDRGDRVTVLACDSTCAEMPGGPAMPGPEHALAVSEFLRRIAPEGGSDVTGAVRRARAALGSVPDGAARIVYIGDGTPTIGAVLPAFVTREVQAAVPRAAGTITAVAIGADADVGTLHVIADAGGGALVPYVPGQNLREAAYAVLGATYGSTLADAELDVPDGLIEAAPERMPTVLAGGETVVTFRMTRAVVDGTLTLRGKVLGVPFTRDYPIRLEATTGKGNAFVPRLWAAAEIAELEKNPDLASRTRAIGLSQQFHVASRYTSLLVLESAAMFQAFGLEKREHVADWTGEDDATSTVAEADKVDIASDEQEEPKDAPLPAKKSADDSFGIGELGSSSGAGLDETRRGAPARSRAEAPSEPRAAASQAMPVTPSPAPESDAFAQPPPAVQRPGGSVAKGKQRLADGYDGDDEGALEMRPRPMPLPRRLVPMRKVWERVGRVVTPVVLPAVTTETLASAERAAAGDTARDALKKLYALLFRSGDVERASAVAERWSAKDPLDPDALTARADIAAARGERDVAIRILGSVVDVRPGDHKAQWRLARLHRWAGRAELGCRHSLAVAQIRSTDAKLLSEAVRCARDVGHGDVANDLLASVDDTTRALANRFLTEPAADPNALSGDITLEASWEGGDDLDLSMLEPEGYRVSWLGAPTKAVITASDVQSTQREGLALRGSSPGDYVVEITRPEGHTGTLRGSLRISAAGDHRTIPFTLDSANARVALIKITSRSKLVPL